MAIRLMRGGAYTSDINTLRGLIRANGTLANLHVATISHPLTVNTVNVHINMAYQSNSNSPAVNGSIYAVAFGNANGIWHFTVGAIGVVLPGVAFPGALDGSYASLGYAMALPGISDANLAAAINAVHGYNGGAVGAPVLDGMARLIIAANEAVRFDSVTTGVNSVLGTGVNFAPPVAQIHAWGAHTLGG